jgi:hypothetical protein
MKQQEYLSYAEFPGTLVEVRSSVGDFHVSKCSIFLANMQLSVTMEGKGQG